MWNCFLCGIPLIIRDWALGLLGSQSFKFVPSDFWLCGVNTKHIRVLVCLEKSHHMRSTLSLCSCLKTRPLSRLCVWHPVYMDFSQHQQHTPFPGTEYRVRVSISPGNISSVYHWFAVLGNTRGAPEEETVNVISIFLFLFISLLSIFLLSPVEKVTHSIILFICFLFQCFIEAFKISILFPLCTNKERFWSEKRVEVRGCKPKRKSM